MSLNITVNGKFTKHGSSRPIIGDAEYAKKKQQYERRKLRLQEVRMQSNELARRIRSDVSEEKRKQLDNLEEVKAQELQCWRDYVLAQKSHDYSNACFQVGSAHHAAQVEKEENAAKRAAATNTRSKRTKSHSPNRTCFAYPSTVCNQSPNRNTTNKCPNEIPRGAKIQPYHVYFDEKFTQYSCSSSSLSDLDSDEKSDTDVIDTCELLGSSSSNCSMESCKYSKVKTSKKGTIVRHEDVEDSDNPDICPIYDINKNCRAVAASPRKAATNSATALNVLYTNDQQCIGDDSRTSPTSTSIEIAESEPPPRYTLISELIEKQRSSELPLPKEIFYPDSKSPKPSPTRKSRSPTRRSVSTAATVSTGAPSGLSRTPANSPAKKSPVKTKQTEKVQTAKPTQESRKSLSKSTTTLTFSDDTAAKTARSSVVQFYDYNNKFSKDYIVPPGAAALPALESHEHELNAMDRAAIEKSLQKEREKEIEKMQQKSAERGKIALEREQVRRDCNELTQKLEALTQQRHNLLPTDAPLHGSEFYQIKAARKESKLNNAIEELLSRPAVITCPEVKHDKAPVSLRVGSSPPIYMDSNELNLGAPRNDIRNSKSCASSDSGSILLGYIDDQRDQIRNEISQFETCPSKNQEKRDKLMTLLKRIESLRESLLSELKEKNVEEPQQKVGDQRTVPVVKCSSSTGAIKKQPRPVDAETKTIEVRERELREREYRIEHKMSELLEIQKSLMKGTGDTATAREVLIKTGKEQIIEHKHGDKPLEIVIKVKGEKRVSKRKAKIVSVGPSKTTLPQQQISAPRVQLPHVPPAGSTGTSLLPRRESYDSNSTAYRPMPPALSKTTEQFVNRLGQYEYAESNTNSNETSAATHTSSTPSNDKAVIMVHKKPRAHLNPLIAQYVQRLLGMSRKSVMALEVSSSDIETPGSSIINVTANMRSGENTLVSEDHMERVERFINDNRSFIDELEESMRAHSNSSLETSMRRFENIWKQRLKEAAEKQALKAQSRPPVVVKMQSHNITKSKPKVNKDDVKPKTTAERMPQKSVPSQRRIQIAKTPVAKATENGEQVAAQSQQAANAQFEHYAELTKNCSKRIAELTELITNVRKEKKRLLEVTLTSVSDNERLSTEYGELPNKAKKSQAQQRKEQHQDTASDGSVSDNSPQTTTAPLDSHSLNEMPSTTTDIEPMPPLEKHKKTGRSRDSGISMPSRPVTALGPDVEVELQSHTSPTSMTANTQSESNQQRKTRHPPASLHRFSPVLPEDDAVHELSTIAEVDTPATSRLNTSLPKTESQLAAACANLRTTPIGFPTFEEYVKELHLDLTIMDPEQSIRMEREYNELINAIKEGRGNKAFSYKEFPALTSYLQDITASEDSCRSPETMQELFACLRLTPMTAKPFFTHGEYMQRLTTNSPEHGYIDTESLENLTEMPTIMSDSESDSTLNIEEELKRRNILKQSFRSSSTRQDFASSSTGDKHLQSKTTSHSTNMESGIERLAASTSTDSASEKFQQELLALGLQWPKSMRNKEKEAAALSSTSTEFSTKTKHEKFTATMKVNEKKDKSTAEYLSDSESSERPLNLRDFLTRQLLKHAAATSSCESSLSGDSLRSQFFLAVLDSMSPSGTPHTNTGGQSGGRLERKKTSTPVPLQSGSTNDNIHEQSGAHPSQTQLFSGESRLSSVYSATHKKQSTKSKTRLDEKNDDGCL